MASEAAETFVKRYGSNEAFRNKVSGLDSPQAIRAYLDQEGFGQFTRQELEDARTAASTSGELSDAQLEAVAGGAWGAEWDYTCDGHKSGDPSCPTVHRESCDVHECTSVW